MRIFILLVFASNLLGLSVWANSCTAVGAGWSTKAGVQCAGHIAGDVYTVTWRNASGAVTGTVTGTAPTNLPVTIEAPAGVSTGDRFTVTSKNSGRCGTGTQIALLDPPASTAVATHALTSGSAVALGETFDLTGGFQILADSLDQNPMSADFGRLSGSLLTDGFQMVGISTSSNKTFQIQLESDRPFVTNLAALLQSPFLSPANTNFELGFFGTLVVVVDGVPSPMFFEGEASGTSSYGFGPESPENYAMQFQLFTEMGEFSGSFTSAGSVRIIDRFPDISLSFDPDAGCIILTYLSVDGVSFGVLGGDLPDSMLPLDPTPLGDGTIQQYKHTLPGNSSRFFYRFTDTGSP